MKRNKENIKRTVHKKRIFVAALLVILTIILTVSLVKIISGSSEPAIPVNEMNVIPKLNVRFNTYKNENFITKDGFKYYEAEDGTVSKFGIDVSFAQKEIEWEKVKSDGIDFAMIRLGYRGYESGKINLDEYFERNMKGAADAGIETGVYFFSQAVNEHEAEEEAEFVIKHIKDHDIKYPVAFDWEIISENTARTDNIPQDVLNSSALAFCQKIKEAGYQPIIYASLNLLREYFEKYDVNIISEYDLWLAEYKEHPEYPYEFKMWQYSNEGIINGINYPTDVNVFFVTN